VVVVQYFCHCASGCAVDVVKNKSLSTSLIPLTIIFIAATMNAEVKYGRNFV